jgi:hypothetical protein
VTQLSTLYSTSVNPAATSSCVEFVKTSTRPSEGDDEGRWGNWEEWGGDRVSNDDDDDDASEDQGWNGKDYPTAQKTRYTQLHRMVHFGSYPNRTGHYDSNELVHDFKHRGLDYIPKMRGFVPYTGLYSSSPHHRASNKDYLFPGYLYLDFTSGCRSG